MLAGLIKDRGRVGIKQIKIERRQYSITRKIILFSVPYLKNQTEPCNSEYIQSYHFEQHRARFKY